jgi:hypothetical protein
MRRANPEDDSMKFWIICTAAVLSLVALNPL